MTAFSQLQDYFPGRPFGERSYTPLMILGIARSGSTLLRFMLNRHPDIILHGEVFNQHRSARERTLTWKERSNAIYEGGSIRSFLRSNLFPADAEGKKVVGFKHFPGHTLWLHNPERFWQLISAIPHLKILVIKRENILDIALSRERAKRDNTWVRWIRMSPQEQESIHLDPRICLQHFTDIQREYQEVDAVLTNHPKRIVTYNDLILQPETCMRELCEWLGVETINHLPPPVVQRQRRIPREKAILNFQDLRQTFEKDHPEWLHFFDEEEHFAD